jgi:hypothetical protein
MAGAGKNRTTADAIIGVQKRLVQEHGADVLVWFGTTLKRVWALRFAKKNIVVLGPKQSGKSSLICYLAEGRPFKMVDGIVRTPDPTGAAVILSEDFKLPDGVGVAVGQDVPGDPVFRTQWKDLLQLVRPHGIIYMLDGSLGERAIRAGVDELFRDVLSHYKAGSGSLASLHIFLNFADKWRTAPGVEERGIECARGFWYEAKSRHPELGCALDYIRFYIAATHLSPHVKAWPDTDRALNHFSADIS